MLKPENITTLFFSEFDYELIFILQKVISLGFIILG